MIVFNLSYKDQYHLISLIFTQGASQRLPSAAMHPANSGIASALNALHMKASDSCKIEVLPESGIEKFRFTFL